VGSAPFGSPQLLFSLGSIPAKMPRETRRPNCLLPSPHLSTGPDRGVLGLWMLQGISSDETGPSPKILERSAPQGLPLRPRLGNRATSTSTDTGCPSLLMLPLDPLLHHRKQACLALTLEIASYLGITVKRAAALTNVAGATDLPLEIVHSHGATAVARGLVLDLPQPPREIDTIEAPHPGGETKTHHAIDDLLCEASIFLLVFDRRTFE